MEGIGVTKYRIVLDTGSKTSETYRVLKNGTFGKRDSVWNEELKGKLFKRLLLEYSNMRNVLSKRLKDNRTTVLGG